MTTHKNKAARAAETREEKRSRLADPALDSVEEQRKVQDSNPTLQSNQTAARKLEFENRKRELEADIIGLKRMKDRAARGYSQASRQGYDRIYARLTTLAQTLADEFGHSVSIPAYDPPTEGLNGPAVTIQPRSAAERASDGRYRETLGMGASGKGGPVPNFASPDNTAWMNVQGGGQ